MGLCFLFMLIELGGGVVGHSLAIITDALHMLTDVFSFALAIYATFAAKQKATSQFTFGCVVCVLRLFLSPSSFLCFRII